MELFPFIWLILSGVSLIALLVFKPNHHVRWLIIILLLVMAGIWISLPDNPGIHVDINNDGTTDFDKSIEVRQGLDLAGGLQVLLEADAPEGTEPSADQMAEIRRIVSDRIDSLGALEPVVQTSGSNRLIVELPGYSDPERATELIRQTALLEFVELDIGLEPGTVIKTDYSQASGQATNDTEQTPEGPVYHTVMTGEILRTADVQISQNTGEINVAFTLTPEGSKQFGDYTSSHVGRILGIVLDGTVISSPTIQSAITGGEGVITGQFTLEEAQTLSTQLRYGALPLAMKVQSTSSVGPTLGQISVEQSVRAGLIGISVVLLFMLIYYRLPGIAAALALLVFAILNFSIFKLVPVTLTLPAITGFLISVGTAVDGNILIFERMKEELRAGKRLSTAIDAGFGRAWASIRDSNLSTIIICAVLYAFGSSFGAGAVRGFAVTLTLGLVINLFTATTVTRTFLHFILKPISDDRVTSSSWMFGL